MVREIVAVYRHAASAEAAQRDLLQAGIPPLRVHLHHSATPVAASEREGRRAWHFALLGGAIGFVTGGLATVLLSFLPSFSWLLASEDWASIIGGSAAGAWLGAIAGGLGVRRRSGPAPTGAQGDSLLRVDADEQEVDRVVAVLQRHRPDRLDRGLPAGPGVEHTQLAQNRPPTDRRPGEEPV